MRQNGLVRQFIRETHRLTLVETPVDVSRSRHHRDELHRCAISGLPRATRSASDAMHAVFFQNSV